MIFTGRLRHVAHCLTGAPTVSSAVVGGGDDEELYWISIAEATDRFAAGTLTPVELLAACLARIDATENRLNSFVKDMRETAMQQAKASTERWKAGSPLGPLDGIPICVKGTNLNILYMASNKHMFYVHFI